MSDKNISKKWFQSLFVMGVVLIAGSLVVWLTPTVVLEGIGSQINSPELHGPLTETQQEMVTDLEWSEIWWKTKQITVFNPTSMILFAYGMVLIICALLVRFT